MTTERNVLHQRLAELFDAYADPGTHLPTAVEAFIEETRTAIMKNQTSPFVLNSMTISFPDGWTHEEACLVQDRLELEQHMQMCDESYSAGDQRRAIGAGIDFVKAGREGAQ